MNVYLDMVGCRLNQAEIDALALELTRRGAKIVPNPGLADTIIINTCCVTKKACADSRKMIRHYRETTQARLISTGCWVSVALEEAAKLSDAAIANPEKEQLPEFLMSDSGSTTSRSVAKPNLGKRSRTRGFVKIQDGCDNSCSYCLTTIARGRSHSKSVDEVLARVQDLEAMGVKEIVLTGVQLGSWGKDFGNSQRLSHLLFEILDQTSIPRIRLSSIEPWDVDQALISVFKDPRLCAHLHIPLQNGADQILRSMRRPIKTSRYLELLEEIRAQTQDLSITTDIIAGFPGETDELFDESFEFIRKCQFNGGHVFSFSPMPGTVAAEMENQVHEAVIKQRARRLIQHFDEQAILTKEKMVGSEVEVLIESRKCFGGKTIWTGFAENYIKVSLSSDRNDLSNRIIRTKIKGMDEKGHLIGLEPDFDDRKS